MSRRLRGCCGRQRGLQQWPYGPPGAQHRHLALLRHQLLVQALGLVAALGQAG